MPLVARKPLNYPDHWSAFGHSWLQYAFGTFDQTGRADALLRSAMHIEMGQWRNFCVNGARLINEGRAQGGYIRVFQERAPNIGRGGPYAGDGGGAVFCYGINDLGMLGTTSGWRDAFKHALRAAISRWRAATIFENSFQVGTRTTYGAGFGSVAATDFSSGSDQTVHWCTDTSPDADDLFTCTLPSDYNGEPVVICLVGAAGTTGGTVTWSGTAGVTGTTNVSAAVPSGGGTHTPVIKRVTNLTSANAGQTIVGTVTAMDAGGSVMLDCWWLEAKNPGPVIVCDVARLTSATAYTTHYPSWSGTESAKDQNVLDLNTDIASVVAEFNDPMVQIAYCDAKIQKNSAYMFDGLHPNEIGAGLVADAIVEAIGRLNPAAGLGETNQMNTPSPRSAFQRKPRLSNRWFTCDYTSTGNTIFNTVGNLYALPFVISEGRERYIRMGLRVGSTGGGTAHQIRWGLYDDPQWTGYPQCLYNEATAATGPISVGTTANAWITNPSSGSGSISWPLDPGLWWIAIKITTAGATQTLSTATGPDLGGIMPQISTAATPVPLTTPIAWLATGLGSGTLPTVFPAYTTTTEPTSAAPRVHLQKQ